MCSMKSTGAGVGAVWSFPCTVCSALPLTGEDLTLQIIVFILGFQKRIASI